MTRPRSGRRSGGWGTSRNSGVGWSVLPRAQRRLRSVNQMLGDMAFLDVPTRMAKQLLQLAETYSSGIEEDGTVEVTLGQDDLARLVGASRETISRALNSYRRLGILSTSHRRITITDRSALERMASF